MTLATAEYINGGQPCQISDCSCVEWAGEKCEPCRDREDRVHMIKKCEEYNWNLGPVEVAMDLRDTEGLCHDAQWDVWRAAMLAFGLGRSSIDAIEDALYALGAL